MRRMVLWIVLVLAFVMGFSASFAEGVTSQVSTSVQAYRESDTNSMYLTVRPGIAFEIKHVLLHLNAAGASGTLTITRDAESGAAWDAVLTTPQAMVGVTDYVWTPTLGAFGAGDGIHFDWANAGGKTWAIEFEWVRK